MKNSLCSIPGFSNEELKILSMLTRKSCFEICLTADDGHIGGSSAAVELFTVLYFGDILRFNPRDPNDPQRDRVLVRGHLGPLRYKIFSLLGWLDENELSHYRRIGSRLHGHEDYLETPGVDLTPSGSLGMLMSYGVGAALGARNNGDDFRVFVFLGDGEEQEGIVSEAARHAAHLKLDNIVGIIDCNGKQLSNPIKDTDSASLATLWEGYGWNVVNLKDGHDITFLREAYEKALTTSNVTGRPTVIIAKTIKGIGLEGAAEHFSGYHTMGRVKNEVVERGIATLNALLDPDLVAAALKKIELIKGQDDKQTGHEWCSIPLTIAPKNSTPNHPDNCQLDYFHEFGQLVNRGIFDRSKLYFLTADVTTAEVVQRIGLDRIFHFYNVGIREQHMVAMAHGLSVSYPEARILINSFDAFTYRGLDQLNAALQGNGNMIIIGDVAGITNARNGKTHQTVGHSAALLAMEGLTFLEPWDAIDTFACLNWALGESRRVVYIRIHSSRIEGKPDDKVKRTLTYYTVRDTDGDPDLVIVSAGFTIDSCLQVSDHLRKDGIQVRVINVINPNALNEAFGSLITNGRPLLTVYNGHPRILRQAVADALLQGHARPSVLEGVGFTIGTTGTFEEIRAWTKLDADGILCTAKRLL
ncbi:MAG: transketolase C-terminal domain-containing protein [Patescibacteria group bacterium]